MQKNRTSCTFCSYEDRRERFSDRKTSGFALKVKKRFLDGLVHVMEKDGGLDREAALANMRFNFIEKLCEKTVVKPAESREHKRSVAIDRILTGKYTAIPCFVGIMAIVFVMYV